MIKFRITDDEFKQYTEDFSVSEFKPLDAVEFYSPKEIPTPPQENLSIQEDSGNFGQQQYDQRTSDFHQDINRNTSENNQSEISSNNSASSNSSGTGSVLQAVKVFPQHLHQLLQHLEQVLLLHLVQQQLRLLLLDLLQLLQLQLLQLL